MSDEVRNVFMSHIHEDDDALPQLKGLVSKNGLVVRDGSINADKPNRARSDDYIKSGILAPRIQWASVLVTLVSPETRTSAWVDWEIEYAHKLGKRIVGVWMRGARDADLPMPWTSTLTRLSAGTARRSLTRSRVRAATG